MSLFFVWFIFLDVRIKIGANEGVRRGLTVERERRKRERERRKRERA